MKKIKILAASDIHSDHRIAQKLAERAEKEDVDLVLLCGDLTHFDTDATGIIGPFVKKGKPVMFVPGNHDSPATAEFLATKYEVHNIDGYGVIFGDIGIFGCGGANTGPHFRAEEDIFDYLKRGKNAIQSAKKHIMITHVHPSGGIVEENSFPGSESVRRAIEEFKPQIHISGHIHEMEGATDYIGKTKLFTTGKYGTIIEI